MLYRRHETTASTFTARSLQQCGKQGGGKASAVFLLLQELAWFGRTHAFGLEACRQYAHIFVLKALFMFRQKGEPRTFFHPVTHRVPLLTCPQCSSQFPPSLPPLSQTHAHAQEDQPGGADAHQEHWLQAKSGDYGVNDGRREREEEDGERKG